MIRRPSYLRNADPGRLSAGARKLIAEHELLNRQIRRDAGKLDQDIVFVDCVPDEGCEEK